MSVSSVDRLEALPVGTVIEVNGRRPFTWTRTAKGWESEGAVLTSEFFVGHIEAGQVVNRSEAEPAFGQWWTDGDNHYMLMEFMPEARRLPCLVFPADQTVDAYEGTIGRNTLRRYQRSGEEQMRVLVTPDRMATVARLLSEARAERDQRTQEVHSMKNRPDPAALQPQVVNIGEALATAAESVRVLSVALGNGQTEF